MNISDIFAQNGLVIQEETYTCGPCSLLNILALKGDTSHTEMELAERCNAQPGVGTSHEDLARCAQQLGLLLVAEKENGSIEELERHLDDGDYIIVNYIDRYSGNGHYAVIAEHDKRAFYLRDCTTGLFRLEKQYLLESWRSSDGIPRWFMAIRFAPIHA